MANNIGVTLLNKAAFATVDFHYPFFLSAIHMACNMAGAAAIFYSLKKRKKHDGTDDDDDELVVPSSSQQQQQSHQQKSWIVNMLGGETIHRQQLDAAGQRMILAFSVIFSLNIAIGNVSLKHVSVNFNQVMRSLVPAITIAMGLCLKKPISPQRLWAVVPIVIGVAMACFGDMSFTATGFIVTVLCIVLAALKVVASGEMLTGPLKLHPVDLLGHMAPLALIQCMAMAFLTGEIKSIASRWDTDLSPTVDVYPMAVVWFSGILSFSLNICSLQANKVTSPLTLCIAANVKQVLMIAVSTIMFGTYISPLNGAGILVVLAGSARYSYISVMEKKPNKQQQQHSKSTEGTVEAGEVDEEAGTSEVVPLVNSNNKDRMQRN
jgi:drug/metabolite transporter (DMT)-like permease